MAGITLDELLLRAVAEEIRNKDISHDNLLLSAFWDPDHADLPLTRHGRHCNDKRHTQLLQLASLIGFARTLGQLQRRRLLAVYPAAEALYGYRTWLQRAPTPRT